MQDGDAKTDRSWTKVGENLVRHWGGTIYLRAKVAGKPIRVSLETSDLRIAKLARDAKLASLRKAAAVKPSKVTVRTVGDALHVIAERLTSQSTLEPESIKYYKGIIRILERTLPLAIHGRAWSASEAAVWWKKLSSTYSPQRANNTLGVARQVGDLIVECGIRMDNPTAKLRRRKIPDATMTNIPSREQVDAIIRTIREQKKSKSDASANYVAFLAFAGCRHGQAKAFCWEHVEKDWLLFPSGVSGTKGAATRRLPISPPLRAVLDAMLPIDPKEAKGPIFKIVSPRIALANACKRLGLSHLRIHDLRHFFGTYAIESGVDIPTVAKWLGHKDGGRLLLKIYSHVRDAHSLASASKLSA